MDLSIERRPVFGAGGDTFDDRIDLVARGRIDIESAEELEAAVDEELRLGRHTIRLDLTEVGFLSSAGIRVLFNIHRAAKATGGSCLISAASEPITRVLTLARLAPILMEQPVEPAVEAVTAGHSAPSLPATATPRRGIDQRIEGILLTGCDSSAAVPVDGCLLGSSPWTNGRAVTDQPPVNVLRAGFGIGIGCFADEGPAVTSGGELLAACGAVFIRPPRPFAAADSIVGSGDHVPAVRVAAGLFWEGLPRGLSGFEAAGDETAVRVDELVSIILDRAQADVVAVVIVAEVQGLVGAELIRPLAEALSDDHPTSGIAATAARWLSFSREPVHPGTTAVIVGVASRNATGALASFVRPLDGAAAGAGPTTSGHLHAAIFPHRPLRRGVSELTPIIDDLAASAPLAVMHLLGDPLPVLGSGQSELVRGVCWFAPLTIRAGTAG